MPACRSPAATEAVPTFKFRVMAGVVRTFRLRVKLRRTAVASATLRQARDDDVQSASVTFADQQYDAAVADLEGAVHKGRGRLDANTIAIVEHNLQIIDQAIAQARQALGADPANGYLSSHLVEARRRKLDLLRRAAALSGETD